MDQQLLEAVVEVNAVAGELGIGVVLVGALVMEFTAEVRPSYPQPKMTNDADFAVLVGNWESFNRLRTELEKRGFARVPHVEHRLRRREEPVLIDLIPVGEGISEDGRIVWPESRQEMIIIGFEEVCTAASSEVKAGLPNVPVISVPGFVLLKIIAFRDRHKRGDLKYRNDVEHVAYWLENYASLAEMDNRRLDFLKAKGGWDMDVNLAGAALLGQEVARLCFRDAREQVVLFLLESTDLESPFVDAAMFLRRPLGSIDETDSFREDVLDQLKAFERGFKSVALHRTRFLGQKDSLFWPGFRPALGGATWAGA